MDETKKYWFNIKTKLVEKGLKSSSLNRIGPFETEEEAKNAEETVRARSKLWKKQEDEEN